MAISKIAYFKNLAVIRNEKEKEKALGLALVVLHEYLDEYLESE